MKIYGPYTRKDGRQHIILYEDGYRQTMSYPRYLMETCLGRKLEPWEDVHHKDNDFTNNDINNLEVKEFRQHIREHTSIGRMFATYDCPMCGKEFEREENKVKHNRKQGKAGPFCSRRCSGIYSVKQQTRV